MLIIVLISCLNVATLFTNCLALMLLLDLILTIMRQVNLERHASGFQICLFHSFVKENFVKTRQIMEIEVNFYFGKMCANKQQEYTFEYLCRIGIVESIVRYHRIFCGCTTTV